MKQGRTPDRVHVVRPPQDDFRPEDAGLPSLPAAPQNSRAMEIIRTLAQISDKLKRSEAERYELLAELREYRKSLNELEDKAEKSEKAYLSLENKIKSRDAIDGEITQRQARFERSLKDAESKLVQAAASQNLLDTRLKNTEEFQTAITSRIDETVTQQARLDRQMEKIGQDKTRMLRKVERMEEILTETQDTLKARALVLLTDQSAAAGNLPQVAAYGDRPDAAASEDAPWWRKSFRMQGLGMASMVIAALLFGWTINQVQQPDIPKIAVLENGGLARLDLEKNKWEPLSSTPTAETNVTSQAPATAETAPAATPVDAEPTLTPLSAAATAKLNAPAEQTPAAQAALDASDEQLMAALEEDPDRLASQLNEIAPSAREALDIDQPTPAPVEAAPVKTSALYDPLKPFTAKAFAQDPKTANLIAKERSAQPLSARVQRDASLPTAMQKLENQALAGVPEAQHDLAAIYTAGRGGVPQNFEKAAFWFREAANSKVANASYNLGVLYHQGLGVEKDLDRALYWYREAAKLGHPEAQYNLGISHIEGIGTSYDAPLAAAFFESSANQGVIEAAYNLGLIYENGLVSGAKSEDALMWYKLAADGGSADAKAALAQLSSSMKLDNAGLAKLTERMETIYASNHGRRPGIEKKS